MLLAILAPPVAAFSSITTLLKVRNHHRIQPIKLSSNDVVPTLPEWSSLSVVRNDKAAEGLRLVDVQVTPELAALYLHPGQYVKVNLKLF